jgi:DNA-binding HxlR family transcriptional regulator
MLVAERLDPCTKRTLTELGTLRLVTWYTMGTVKDADPVARVEWTMGLIGAKWKPAIMFSLVMEGTLRFSELKRRIPGVTQRMLTQQLRDLERHGLVRRVFYPEIPPRVEYSVTDLGRSLHPIYKSVCDWAGNHINGIGRARAQYDQRAAGPLGLKSKGTGRRR